MRVLAALLLASAAAAAQTPGAREFAPRLERMSLGRFLTFWHPQPLFREQGGCRLHYGGRGGCRPQVDEKLKAGGGKAGERKAAYHNGRAMIQCLAILRGLR